MGLLRAVKFMDAFWRSIDTNKGIEEVKKELTGYRSLNFKTNSG
jgi:hypothetical protein